MIESPWHGAITTFVADFTTYTPSVGTHSQGHMQLYDALGCPCPMYDSTLDFMTHNTHLHQQQKRERLTTTKAKLFSTPIGKIDNELDDKSYQSATEQRKYI